MTTWLVAILGGAVGSLTTAVIAFGARFWNARGEINSHDRFVGERDEDLSSWVSDRTVELRRAIHATTEEMNKENLFYSSTHATAIAHLKEKALHEYRDQERQARRDIALTKEREGLLHRYWRRRKTRPFPSLKAPDDAAPILDIWRSSITRHGSPPIEVQDPTKRSLAQARQNEPINDYT